MPSWSVLIADDDPLVRESLGDCLDVLGCRVRVAVDGSDAIAVLGAERVDLLVSDIDMPRASGFQVLDWLRLYWPATPVILMSGRTDADLTQVAHRAGARSLLAKPVEMQRFTALVASILQHHTPVS